MARVLISMPEDFLQKIDQVADGENRSRSELIREALRTYIYKQKVRESTTSAKNAEASTTDIEEIKYTSIEAGVFFIGAVGGAIDRDIYAIRFVPTSEKKDEWVYVGETGYATYGNTSGKDIESLPDGLTAYKATAASNGHSVTLTSLDEAKRLAKEAVDDALTALEN